MKKVVVFLQNAWSKVHAGKRWDRESWLNALDQSRSGQRLRNLRSRCEGIDWWIDNSTPIVGNCPDSVVPADLGHMMGVIRKQKPAIIVCMGLKAKMAWKKLAVGAAYADCSVLFLPHPAYRLLSSKLLWDAAAIIEDGFEGEIELKQGYPVTDGV